MKLKNQELWNDQKKINSEDPYSKGVIDYAERWMNLMEKGLETGLALKDIWSDCSHQANTDGITGFMYGAATNIISQVWEYGEELRQLHNASYDQPEAEGTVNPAILTVKLPDNVDPKEYLEKKAKEAGFKIIKDIKKLD